MLFVRYNSHNDMNQALFGKVEQGLDVVYQYGIRRSRCMV